MNVRLTRRGTLLAAVVVGCFLLGAVFGARSLNAIVAPGIVALVAGVVLVHRAPVPSIERTVPPDGHPGERHGVGVEVEGCGAGNYEITDRVDPALAVVGATDSQHAGAADSQHAGATDFQHAGATDFQHGTAADSQYDTFHVTERRRTCSYEVTYDRRGVATFGPLSVTVTDVLGLAKRSVELEGGDERVLVYPALVDPPMAVRSSLETVVDLERRPGRDEFDRLREYVRGDSPRDVHWKSSAKQPDDDLVVKEFLGRTPTDAVRISVSASDDRTSADAAARAGASVAITLLEEGVEVGIETPEHTVPAGVGPAQRDAILAALARLEAGPASRAEATIRVTASDGEALVHAAGRAVPFVADGDDPNEGRRTDGQESERRDRTEVVS